MLCHKNNFQRKTSLCLFSANTNISKHFTKLSLNCRQLYRYISLENPSPYATSHLQHKLHFRKYQRTLQLSFSGRQLRGKNANKDGHAEQSVVSRRYSSDCLTATHDAKRWKAVKGKQICVLRLKNVILVETDKLDTGKQYIVIQM